MLASGMKIIFTADPRITQTALSGFWPVGAVTVPKTKSGILVSALIIMAALHFFLQRTRLGKSIRASAQNREAARMVGIRIKTVYALTFAICIALTGVAGVLISPTQAIFPFMGPALTLRAFAITALAGLGSIVGALAGGIFLAMIEVHGRYLCTWCRHESWHHRFFRPACRGFGCPSPWLVRRPKISRGSKLRLHINKIQQSR